jgi:hypothetical protein
MQARPRTQPDRQQFNMSQPCYVKGLEAVKRYSSAGSRLITVKARRTPASLL